MVSGGKLAPDTFQDVGVGSSFKKVIALNKN